MKYAQVAIPLPVEDPFDYELKDGWSEKIQIGSRVRIPFRNREIIGYVVGLSNHVGVEKIKPVTEAIDEEALLDTPFLLLTRWMSEYYL